VGYALDYVEEAAVGTARRQVVGADVKLVNDQVIERRRPKPGRVPRKTEWVPQDAVGVWEGRLKGQHAPPGIALVAAGPVAVDVEQVLIPLLQIREEPGPVSSPDGIQAATLVLLPAVEIAGNIDSLGAGRPDPKRSASLDEGASHRRVR